MALCAWLTMTPSSAGPWSVDHAVLPEARFQGDRVTIRNVRNFRYRSASDFTPAYEDRTLHLSQIESVWYVITPFSTDWRGPAHAFLSFGFADSQYVAISVEARRRLGQGYSMIAGLFRRFQIIYVIGDERDLVGLRSHVRGEETFVYPIRATREQVRTVFVSMLSRANALAENPEFYNTLFNNCTTNILRHVNEVADPRISYGPRILLPGYSDRVAHRRGLLDTDLPLEEARERFRVNGRGVLDAGQPDFSIGIRVSGEERERTPGEEP